MISAPKGVLRLAALKLLSESSLSGTDFANQMQRISAGLWRPSPGSVYLILHEFRAKGLVTELPKREGPVRRYIISAKGKEELSRLAREADAEVVRQMRLLSLYSKLAGRDDLHRKLDSLVAGLGEPTSGKSISSR